MKVVALSYNEYLLLEESGESELGKISCSYWKNKADVFTQNAHYIIQPTGFWGMTMELSLQERRLYKIGMTWRGHYEIRSLTAETSQFFIFKPKSLAYRDYVLLDSDKNEIISVNSIYEGFTTIKIGLSVPDLEKVQSLAEDNLLIYIALYCANRLSLMMNTGA